MLDSKLVGENIARLRRERGMTQQELADNLYVTCQAVSGWERGQFLPSVDNLVDLSKLLDSKITDILDEKELNEFVGKNIQSQDNFSCAEVLSIAPFLSEEQVDKMASRMNEFDAYMLCGLAPFVSAGCLFDLLLRCDELPATALCGLVPFLSSEQVSKIIKK